jgi:hypothetical protein
MQVDAADTVRNVLEGSPSRHADGGALDSSRQCEAQVDATGLQLGMQQPRRGRRTRQRGKRTLKSASKVTWSHMLSLCTCEVT